MSKTITFRVPMVPPSVNHYVKHTRAGKHYVTGEAESFKNWLAVSKGADRVQGKAFYVSLAIVLGAGDRGDVDNFAKLPLDSLAENGAFQDSKGAYLSDAHVRRLIIDVDRKTRPATGWTDVTVGVL